MTDNLLISVDYSIRRPAITIFENGSPRFLSFYRHTISEGRVTLLEYPQFDNNEERFLAVASALLAKLPDGIAEAVFEGYAYTGKGRSFHLAEAAAFFKCLLMQRYEGIRITSLQPSTVKKFATGNGNATKDSMIATYLKECPDVADTFSGLLKTETPLNDIADSYWIGKTHMSMSSAESS